MHNVFLKPHLISLFILQFEDLCPFVSNVLRCGAIVLTILMAILRANIAEITNPIGAVSKINRVFLSTLVVVFKLGQFCFAKTKSC